MAGPNNYTDIITQLAETPSSFEGIGDVSGLKSRFGINPNLVGNIFGARKRALMSGRARALSSASSRMSGRIANPEAMFSPVEGEYAGALGELEGARGTAELSQEQSLTQMLYNILSGQNQFNLSKQGMQMQALGGKLQERQYEENKPGFLDDFLSILSGVGTVASPVAGYLGSKGIAGAISGKY
jgi:hypothetical protein